MGLSHNELIIIDVTAIVGLFFFITFQSFNPPITDDIKDFWAKVYDTEIELETLENILLDCDEEEPAFYNGTKCAELRIEKYELLTKYETLAESGRWLGYMDNRTLSPSPYVEGVLGVPLTMYWISVLMISPFVVSVIFESIAKLRKNGEPATKTGTIIMVIGFFAIIIGLGIIASLFFSYTSTPWYSEDTDRDGIKDKDEIFPDFNNDKKLSDEEKKNITDPKNPDTDGDGLSDLMEVYHYFTDPNTKDNQEDRFKNI